MDRLGVGIIGAGGIASAHASAWLALGDSCQLVAFADQDIRRAQERAEQFEAQMWFSDPYELLKLDEIHIVSICTPPFNHAELTIAALEAGKHVLVEKPMCCSLEEADKMIETAERNERLLGVVFQWRFTPEFARIKAILENGKLGKPFLALMISFWWRTNEYFQVWWRGTWEKECGGSVINHAIHHIDFLLGLMGDVRCVSAGMGVFAHEIETEDAAAAIARFANGALGVLLSSTATYPEEHRVTIYCELGSVSLPWQMNLVDSRYQSELEEWLRHLPRPEHGGHMAVISDFLSAVQSGRKPLVDGNEGRRSIELATAIYKSAITGQPVNLPIQPDDQFYTKAGLMEAAKAKRQAICS
ncbi:MAG: Gfo/Idh/MocA family oxidoreductase [Armatimonadetes bacterium]|nr:Gfo/Idh/MocA family oxidoreductase [Armatimonadota bacterium]MCX7967543.1 Gfo/Idh/MocA family oxidoreductase [Armatimonadota bacterium]MDW8144406.1 Gfo/Idh/MocA family oxidoreductase [Armatimonadota bacterium]